MAHANARLLGVDCNGAPQKLVSVDLADLSARHYCIRSWVVRGRKQ